MTGSGLAKAAGLCLTVGLALAASGCASPLERAVAAAPRPTSSAVLWCTGDTASRLGPQPGTGESCRGVSLSRGFVDSSPVSRASP